MKKQPNLPPIVCVVYCLGFSRIIYKLGRLAKQRWFAKRFLSKYTQMLKDEHTAIESYQWLLHHMSQIKKEMKEHGDTNYARISNIISTLHDRPPVLAPNLHDVCVDLRKYIGTLSSLSREQWILWVVPLWPILLPMQAVEMIVIRILRFKKSAGSDSYGNHLVTWICRIIVTVYTLIAGWDAVVKKIKEIF